MVSVEQLRAAYSEAVANKSNNEELAAKLGLKLASLNQRMTTLRSDLREGGVTDEQIKVMFPPLTRRTGPRVSTRSAAIAAMIAEAKLIGTPTAPADTEVAV